MTETKDYCILQNQLIMMITLQQILRGDGIGNTAHVLDIRIDKTREVMATLEKPPAPAPRTNDFGQRKRKSLNDPTHDERNSDDDGPLPVPE